MDDTTRRKEELYLAYEEAALRILMDRSAEAEGEKLLEALEDPEQPGAPADPADLAVARTLALCAGRERRSRRSRAALRTLSRAAAVLVVVGTLIAYALFSVSAHYARALTLPASRDSGISEERARLPEEYREERTDAG